MTFTVVWSPAAEQELAGVWLAAENRGHIAAMAAVIDGLLHADPERHGESRSFQRRILLYGGLAVVYEILLDDRLVRVLAVWAT